ncbi:DUF3800 domain-containing protein [Sphingobium sp. ZW T5_29]|uniref:DUF3800 domain-containing protein n=1 Tax=Sphingobium sp. ZW T5_29 TaxID=3378077 RepID=UPI003852971D
MRFVYFDECKYQDPQQPFYWLGALSIAAENISEVEEKANGIAKDFFGTQRLARDTEFHAKDIFHRKRHFSDWDIEKRLACLQRLADLAGDNELVRRLYVRIDPKKMVRSHGWADDAFMFLVEKVQQDAMSQSAHCILIGDLDGNFSEGSVANLSRFRDEGTDFVFGHKIDRLIDSVYFIPSHHSRLLQLADAYTYCLQLCESPDDGKYPRKKMKDYIINQTSVLQPHRYKEWPTDQSWYRAA